MNLLTLKDWKKEDIMELIDNALLIKEEPEKYYEVLKGKTLAMLFEKKSTRTRVSFEVGMAQLGGHALFIDWKTTQLGKADLKDEIKCIASYTDIIMARVYKHKDAEIMAENSKKPFINALSELYHPCQTLADLMTIKEKFGKFDGLKIAYVGDGNNVCNSLIIGCSKLGINISVASPKGYEPKEKPDLLTKDPKEAVKGADVVYTDTWVSMGQEEEKKKRLKEFQPYQVNKKLLGKALFMHCLPAYRGYEVTDDVFDSKQSIVFDQAENRLHTQKAVMLKLMGKI
ncbi:ornithine carbamoyltransferase [Candidatus Woesearchaeota archaeon]|nr:ornithine carbamoyltransferase [Candidatus Woesearchaeota archaeon]